MNYRLLLLAGVVACSEAEPDLREPSEHDVSVEAIRSGKFGNLLGGIQPDADGVEGHVLQSMAYGGFLFAGDLVEVTARGQAILDEHSNFIAGPDGIPGPPERVGATEVPPGIFLPLEEAQWDQTGTLPSIVEDVGALFGACVPGEEGVVPVGLNADPSPQEDVAAFANVPLPEGDPVTGDVASEALFMVGSSYEATADEDCHLFFGVNDSWTGNNSGGFRATVIVTP